MPMRPAQACAAPGCPAIVRGARYCEQHKSQSTSSEYDRQRGTASQRGYGANWRRLRSMFLRRHPLCADPFKEHKTSPVPATDVDHIVPRSRGGSDAFSNLQALCHSCHSRKTGIEMRGVSTFQKALIPTTVVAGPPGSGKTTLVRSRAQWGDLIVDLDAIYSAISGLNWYDKPSGLLPFAFACRDALVRQLSEPSDVRHAWIITSEGKPTALNRLCEQLGAELVILDIDVNECIRRICQDERRMKNWQQWEELAQRWHREYRGEGGVRSLTP